MIAVSNGSDEGIRDLLDPATDYLVTLPTVPRLLTPVVIVLPLQLLAYHIAVRRGSGRRSAEEPGERVLLWNQWIFSTPSIPHNAKQSSIQTVPC